MNQATCNRGPDDEGVFVDNNVSLGHRRLSIIDLSAAGHQPMCNENGNIWIVYNGEIYNFQEIRGKLQQKGHLFKSKTDTEVIIHAYEQWGIKSFDMFNGMWAFCIYDKEKKELILSRDRF
jgi:asparagine synthase (glutamine-hydrolysing)